MSARGEDEDAMCRWRGAKEAGRQREREKGPCGDGLWGTRNEGASGDWKGHARCTGAANIGCRGGTAAKAEQAEAQQGLGTSDVAGSTPLADAGVLVQLQGNRVAGASHWRHGAERRSGGETRANRDELQAPDSDEPVSGVRLKCRLHDSQSITAAHRWYTWISASIPGGQRRGLQLFLVIEMPQKKVDHRITASGGFQPETSDLPGYTFGSKAKDEGQSLVGKSAVPYQYNQKALANLATLNAPVESLNIVEDLPSTQEAEDS
ncbi:hypothetical protein FB451DRAFT_1183609 [Mycena latifolia]|nr:hypothetical protein FB451DRAFT_1183609 [Mycena latifolia]